MSSRKRARSRPAQNKTRHKKPPHRVTATVPTPRTQRTPASQRTTPRRPQARQVRWSFPAWIGAGEVEPTPVGSRRLRLGLGTAVTLASLALFVLTGARDLIAGDTPDFVVASYTWGVPHAPGYPTLTMLGGLFRWLPIGSTVFRIDLLAAVCAAATVAVVYATALRLTGKPWASAAAGIALATTPVYWKWALQIETFPLNNLIVATVAYLLLRWHQQPDRRAFLLGAAFTFGLGLTNQQTVIVLSPTFVAVAWLHRRDLGGSIVWRALGAFAVGLLPYLYVPIAASTDPVLNWDNVHSVSAFIRLVTRQDYGSLALSSSTTKDGPGIYLRRLWYLVRALGVVVGPLALVGAWRAYRRQRGYLLLVGVPFLLASFGFLTLAGFDPRIDSQLFVLQRFFLLPLTLGAPLVAVGVTQLADWLAARNPRLRIRGATALLAGAVVAACIAAVGLNYRVLDVSHDEVTTTYAKDVLSGLKPDTILFVTGDESDLPLLYANAVLHYRPDVTLVIDGIFEAPWYQAQLRSRNQIIMPAGRVDLLGVIEANRSRPAAVVGALPDKALDGHYYLYSDGLAYDVVPQAENVSLDQAIADNTAKLAGYHLPNPKLIKPVSFEGVILQNYSAVAFNLADQCEQLKQRACAISWYRRALQIDPRGNRAEITKRLHRLGVD